MDMDVRLLEALSNLSFALEQIAESLKDGASAKSDVAKALSGGDFFKVISEIKVGIDELKESVSEVSIKQDTILEMTKENSKKLDVQTDLIRKQGNILQGIQTEIKSNKDKNPIDTTNEKNQSGIKKGIATILLIAVAVLAIGAAFKLIGGVNFLSVIALSAGIYIVALAFERIANMNLTPKKALEASLIMVIMSGAIMVSSWLLSMVSPMSITQVLTSISIAGLFYFVMPVMMNVMDSMMNPVSIILPNGTKIKTTKFDVGKLISTAIFLPILMFTMSMGIMLSSRVLSAVRPMGIGQIITSLLIAGMFALAVPAIVRVVESIGQNKLGFSKLFQISLILPLVLLGISFSIMLSSYVLGMVKPIGIGQAITAILIAGMFTVISFGIGKLLNAFSDISPSKALVASFLIPILMTAISIAVMLSSWALGLVKPISFSQFFTALGISIIFIAFSFSMKMIVDSVSKFSPMEIMMLPLLFTAFSLSIMLSSWVLSMVKPITGSQFLTALGISAIFVVIAFSIKLIGSNLDKIDIGSVWKVPLIFTAFSLAIMLSSHILSASADIAAGKILNLLFFSVVLGVSAVIVGLAIWVLNKLNLKMSDIVKGGLAIVMIATVIMLSSLILSIGDYSNYPGLGWSIGVAASLIAFGLGAFAIGSFVTGPQALATLAGLGAIVLIATAITTVSFILSAGRYDSYPGLGWAAGVALVTGGFGIAALGLGVAILGTLGIGAVALAIGLGAIAGIATTIVSVSYILSDGKYEKYPTFGWVTSIGMVGTGFGLSALALGVAILGTLGIGAIALRVGLSAIESIAQTIVNVSNIFSIGNWNNGPSVKWSSGVSSALSAFMPIYEILSNSQDWFFSGPSTEDFTNAIKMISEGIVTAAKNLSLGDGIYKNGPTESWSKGIYVAFKAFSPIYEILSNSQDWFSGPSVEDFSKAIKSISNGIVTAARELALGDIYKNGPTKEWASGVSQSIEGFMPVYEILSDSKGWLSSAPSIGEFVNAIKSISSGIVVAAKSLSVADIYKNGPTKEWASGVSQSIEGFMPVYKILSDSKGWLSSAPSIGEFVNAIKSISSGIVVAAKSLSVADIYKNGPTYEWASGVSQSIKGFMPVYKILSDSKGWLSSAPSVEDFVKAIKTISGGIVVAAKSLSVADIYKNGPTYEWASGVSQSIKGFMSVYKILSDSKGLLSSAPSIGEFVNAIESISSGIVAAAKSLSVGDIYKNGPTYEWASGVSQSIKGFMPVYKILSDSKGLFGGPDIEEFKKSIISISYGIKRVADIFSNSKFDNYPNSVWSKGVSNAIRSFKKLLNSTSMFDFIKISNLNRLVNSIISVSKKFSLNSKYFNNSISPDYMKNMISNVSSYIKLLKMIKNSQKFGILNDKTFNKKSINNITDGIVKMARTFDRLSKSLNNFTNSIKSIDTNKLKQLNVMTANISTLSSVDSKSLDSVLKVLESKSSALSKILENKNSESKDNNKNVNQKKSPITVNTKKTDFGKPKKSPEEVKLDMIVKLLYNLNTLFSPGSTFDDFIFKKMSEKGGGAGK